MVNQSKFFSKLISIFVSFLVASCSTTQNNDVTISGKQFKDGNDVFHHYCPNGKQAASLKINVVYISPIPAPGLPLNRAGEALKIVEAKKNCSARWIFANLADNKLYLPEDATYEEIVSYAKTRTADYDPHSRKVKPYTVFLRTDVSNRYVLFFERIYDFDRYNEIKYRSYPNHYFSLTELKMLKEAFTIIEPIELQQKKYIDPLPQSCNGLENYIPENRESTESYPQDTFRNFLGYDRLNKDLPIDIADAIRFKKEIWERYLIYNSTVKESPTNDPQIKNIEVSLDLNDFCKYGRKVSDLQSR